MTDSIFGPLYSAGDIEQAAKDQLMGWMDTYLAEYERQHSLAADFFARPKTYEIVDRFMKWPEGALPAILVISTGTTERPQREGDGSYRAVYALAVGVIVSARDAMTTTAMVRAYAAVIRALILQWRDGRPGIIVWEDERFDPLPDLESGQTVTAAQVTFTVEVDGVANNQGGPATGTPPSPALAGTVWPTPDPAKIGPATVIDLSGAKGKE